MTDRVMRITGASAGIGTEPARVFASKGHRLALVDQRGDLLTTLASEIVAAGGTAPILIACDLEHPMPATKLLRPSAHHAARAAHRQRPGHETYAALAAFF